MTLDEADVDEELSTGHGPAVLESLLTDLNPSITGQWFTDNQCAFYTNDVSTLFHCKESEIYNLPHD